MSLLYLVEQSIQCAGSRMSLLRQPPGSGPPSLLASAVRRTGDEDAADHIELFSSYGGINGWSANGLTVRLSGGRFAPAAFDDEWLSELSVGARVSLDPSRHLWLGSEFLSVWNQGPVAPGETAHWNTFRFSATFEFGQ